jgi:hypothetical protein
MIVLNINSNDINLNIRHFSFSVYSYIFYVESVLVVLTSMRIFTDKIFGFINDAASSLCSFIYNENQFSIPKILFFV